MRTGSELNWIRIVLKMGILYQRYWNFECESRVWILRYFEWNL